MPSEWKVYSYRCMPLGTAVTHYYELIGAVAPNITKGKRVGTPNWAKKDKATLRTVYITPTEHDAWKANWEKTTGLCSECTGTGEVLKSWSAKEGVTHRPCRKCNGAGTPTL